MQTPNEVQVGGQHYKSAFQPWDFTLDVFEGDFFLGNANKYIVRRKGNRTEDLKKALHYLEKYVETLESGRNTPHKVLSNEALQAIMASYAEANALTLAEEAALTCMAIGKIHDAIAIIKDLK